MAQLKYILLALGAALATAYFGLGVNVPRLHFILGKVWYSRVEADLNAEENVSLYSHSRRVAQQIQLHSENLIISVINFS